MRIDLYLFEKGLCSSRTEAKGFIQAGAVKVNGNVITKPAFEVNGDENIEIDTSSKRYVSRGGLKLEAALSAFSISPAGRLCIDVGASSGGFTDCLLQNGAEKVIAIDSGIAQLVSSLRNDARVICVEKYNARYLVREDLEYVPDFAVMDVSFISATLIIPALYSCLANNSDFICLVKPQFEVGRSFLGKGGIVKDQKARENALKNVVKFAAEIGFDFCGSIVSPIEGGDGNVEYLAHFKKF
jgi:23S rRNA (cytidine1920-2'-O)/16S rRNA (cytidine1409-2'-O)-methyltransferase